MPPDATCHHTARAGLGDVARSRTGGLDLRLGAHPGERPRIRARRAPEALGGLAVDAILRRDGERGAVVALAVGDVSATPAESELRSPAPTRCLRQRVSLVCGSTGASFCRGSV